MGCANSGPVKDMVSGKANDFLVKNGGTGKMKKAMDDTITDVSHLDIQKAKQDLEQIGEGLKETVQGGVEELMGKVSPTSKNETSPSPVESENKNPECQSSPSSPVNDSTDLPATEDTELSGRKSHTSIKESNSEEAVESVSRSATPAVKPTSRGQSPSNA